jgi:hypothetical protein
LERVSCRTNQLPGVLLLAGTALVLAACAAGPNELVDTGPDPAGFWLGLWQGLISPITFIVSLFTTNVSIYEVQNNGNWYDFGFMLGVACAFGSGGWGGTAGVRRTQSAPGTEHLTTSGSNSSARRRVNRAAVAPSIIA